MANYFTDRVVQYPGRVVMTPVQGEANTYDMSRAEGNVTAEGTRFNADTFNDIADDIIQDADDNIITSNELQTLATALGVTPAKLYGILDAILSRLTAPVVVQNMTVSSRTYPANAAYWYYGNNVQIPEKAGYTPIGLLEGVSHSPGLIISPALVSGRVAGMARNITSADITIEVQIPVLYIKTELL